MERNVGFFIQPAVEPFEQRTATREVNAFLGDVGIQFGRNHLQYLHNRGIDLHERLFKGIGHFAVRDRQHRRQRSEDIRPGHFEIFRLFVQFRQRRTYGDLDIFGRPFADTHVMLLANVGLDIFGKNVAGHVDAFAADDTAQRNTGDLGRTASDIDHHVALGSFDVQPGAQRRSHRFVNHIDLAAAGMLGRVAHRANLDVRAARRNRNNHLQRRAEKPPTAFNHLDQPAEHQFGGVEIGDHAVFQRTDRTDILVRLAMHLARLLADSHQFARMLVERYDRRLVNDDLAVVYDNRVGRTQVDSQLLCQRKQPHIVSSV